MTSSDCVVVVTSWDCVVASFYVVVASSPAWAACDSGDVTACDDGDVTACDDVAVTSWDSAPEWQKQGKRHLSLRHCCYSCFLPLLTS